MMNSKEIAELTGKTIGHIHRDIKVMLDKLDDPKLDGVDFTTLYRSNGQIAEYNLNHDLTLLLLTGYDIKARMAVIKRWKELEANQPQFTLPQTFAQALALAAQQAQVIEDQQNLIALQKPSVEFVDNYVDSEGLVGIRDAGKILNIPQNTFVKLLEDNKVLFRSGVTLVPFAKWEKDGYFSVKTNAYNNQVTKRTYFTPAGIVWVTNLLRKTGVYIP
jgi:phage antirepressor YoqD-like protein